jgi:hypothetical protein
MSCSVGRMHLASEIGPVPVPAMMFRLLLGSSMAGHLVILIVCDKFHDLLCKEAKVPRMT